MGFYLKAIIPLSGTALQESQRTVYTESIMQVEWENKLAKILS